MKKTCIRLFTFRGEDFHNTEKYLETMLSQGWKLRWSKGVFAGFEHTENKTLRYAVDPYALTSPMNLRRFPKSRLNAYMSNGWYAVSRNKGTYIFCSDDANGVPPSLSPTMASQVKYTCALSSFVFAVLLLAILWKSFTSPAVLYSILLTDIYIVLGITGLFLLLYHTANGALLLSKSKNPTNPNGCKRYILHDIGLFLLLLSVIFLEAKKQPWLLLYVFLPICVVIIGTFILKFVAKGAKDAKDSNRRLIPPVCIIGVVLLLLIPLSFRQLQASSEAAKQERQSILLATTETLPVLHLSDVIESKNVVAAIKENNSILGQNMLYAEEGDADLAIFTNHTTMQNEFLATYIFRYLYIQAQIDYQEAFVEKKYNEATYFVLEEANTYLLQNDSTVYLVTLPKGGDTNKALGLLYSYS